MTQIPSNPNLENSSVTEVSQNLKSGWKSTVKNYWKPAQSLDVNVLTWKLLCAFLFQSEAGKGFYRSPKGQTLREEKKPDRESPFFVCDLQIAEPEDLIGRPVKDASASFSPAEGRMEAFETHI